MANDPAFPEREECPDVPDKEKIPLDTEPIAGGIDAGDLSRFQIPRAPGPFGWADTGNVTPPGETADCAATGTAGVIGMIYNNTGSDQSICAVVGIDEPYVTPDDNLSGFKSRFILKGVVPDEDDHAQKFAILREPIPAGEVGRGVIVGTTPVLMQVEDEGDTSGTVIDGDTSKLISGNGGFANILWKQSGTGDKWAIVRLAGSGGGLPPIYKATADQSGNTVLAKLLLADGTLATGDAEELDVYTDAWKVRTDDLLVLTQDADGQPVAMPAQGCDNVFTVPAGSDDTADTTTWDISDQPSGYGGVTVEAFFRLYWSGTSGDPVYQFIREAKYDSKGALLYVGREVRSVAFDTDSCA